MKVTAESGGLVVEFEKDGKAYKGKVTVGYLRTKLGSYAQGSAASFAECVNEAVARAVPVVDDAPPAPEPVVEEVHDLHTPPALKPHKPYERAKKGV